MAISIAASKGINRAGLMGVLKRLAETDVLGCVVDCGNMMMERSR